MNVSPISSDTLPLSVLDLAHIPEGGTARTALHRSRELAQHAEELGFRRFWLAEHHNFAGIASAATSVAIGFVAEGTSTIRVGAGGVMLPNHAPLVIAEQFGTLDALYPGRIDLGLGRAPGTDQPTMRALRRDHMSADTFPNDVQELQALLVPALQVYRDTFRPSAQLERPHVMLAANVIVADSDDEARRLFTSTQRSFIDGIFRRRRPLLAPPIESIEDYWQPHERAQLESMLSCSFVGSPQTVRAGLEGFVAEHAPDELIVTTSAYEQEARLRSLELLAALDVGAAVSRR